jgi:hypothetical protein
MLVWHFFRPARLRVHYAPGIPCALTLKGRTKTVNLAQKTCGEIAKPWLQKMLFEIESVAIGRVRTHTPRRPGLEPGPIATQPVAE